MRLSLEGRTAPCCESSRSSEIFPLGILNVIALTTHNGRMLRVVTLNRNNLKDSIVNVENRSLILSNAQRLVVRNDAIIVSTHEIVLSL